MSKELFTKEQLESFTNLIVRYQSSIFLFIEDMWGLTPQKPKPQYEAQWRAVCNSTPAEFEVLKDTVCAEWFGNPIISSRRDKEWSWYSFEKGKNITWQQSLFLLSVDKAQKNGGKKHISIRSGHGIGKSSSCSWVILWFLFCFFQSQVPCTAPTSHQMHDVLWKELSKWINKIQKKGFGQFYEWSSDYIRVKIDPAVWFARARTSTKENTEAIAGVHADDVCIIVDEASGVPNQVFDAAEGALTSGNVLVVLISNPTQLTGYFYDSHNKYKKDWLTLAFSGEESPIVDRGYIELKAKHGFNSDEYKIRVKGEFAAESAMDLSGFLNLFSDKKIQVVQKMGEISTFIGKRVLAIDPSGEGKDEATFCVRDSFQSEIVYSLQSTNDKEIARVALMLIDLYKIPLDRIAIDGFGVGAAVGQHLAIASKGKIQAYTILLGNQPSAEEEHNGEFFRLQEDEFEWQGEERDRKVDLYLNMRALLYFRANKWINKGGMIVDHSPENSLIKGELLSIKYKRSLQGNKIQIMSKKEMLKEGIKSPNKADAFALSFVFEEIDNQSEYEKKRAQEEIRERDIIDDRYSSV